jgi:hypothetical protein
MPELAIYGLIGLAAMLFIAGWFAYADEFLSSRINDAHLDDSKMIETGTDSRFRGTVSTHG